MHILVMQRIAYEVFSVQCRFELNGANELTYEELCITYLREYMKYCKSYEGWDSYEKVCAAYCFYGTVFHRNRGFVGYYGEMVQK